MADNGSVLGELVLKAVVVVAMAILLLTAYVYFTQRSQLYFPWPDAAAAPPPGVEAIQLETDDGLRLGAWFIPAAGGSGEATARPVRRSWSATATRGIGRIGSRWRRR